MKIGDIDVTGLVSSACGRRQFEAAYNLECVRTYMEMHLGCTAREVAYGLNLSYDQAKRSVDRIRKEWVGRK